MLSTLYFTPFTSCSGLTLPNTIPLITFLMFWSNTWMWVPWSMYHPVKCSLTKKNLHYLNLVHDCGLHLLRRLLRTRETASCVELLSTKAISGWVMAALGSASFEVCSLLFWVVPATVTPITCNSNNVLQRFNGMFIAISTPGPFGTDP